MRARKVDLKIEGLMGTGFVVLVDPVSSSFAHIVIIMVMPGQAVVGRVDV
jgi:hypothetical protein